MVLPLPPATSPMTPLPMMGGGPVPPIAQPALPPLPTGEVGAPGAILDADFRVLVADAERRVGPERPPWLGELPKPRPDDIRAEAAEQQQAHEQRVLRQAWLEMRLGAEISSIFLSDKLWVELKEIEPQWSPLLRIMHDAIINFVAAQTIQFTSRAAGLVNREERTAIEAHLTEALDEARAVAFREGQGSLIRTLTADALGGMVALYHAPDPRNERCGQRVYRVDPKVVFPIFGRDGVDRVYTVYDAAYPDVLRDFGDGPDGPATRAIQKIARSGKGRGNRQFDLETQHEVVGYWDRQHALILWKGEVIRSQEHRLWVCPWHIGVPNWRQQAGVKSRGGFSLGGDRPGPLISANGVSTPYESVNWAAGSRQHDLARTYEPFLMPWTMLADKLEKGQTRLGYGVDRSLSNPLVWKRSQANANAGAPEPQNFRNGVMEIQEDEEVDTLPMNPVGDVFAPWLELLTMEVQMAIPVPILQGQSVGTQASGNALDVINEMGYAHFAPVPEFMQALLTEWGHRTLLYKKEWPAVYDPDDPEGGFTAYGSGGRGYARRVKLTREMLERAGCYVTCRLSRFSLSGMAAAATTAAQLDQQLHIGTRPFWIEQFGLSATPQQLEADRRDQDMEDAPGYIEAVQVEHLYDQMREAAELGDEESLRRISARAKRVATKQMMHDQQIARMAGMLAGQPEPAPGELPGNAGQPGGNPMPYLSAPEVGRGTGTEGGAPGAPEAMQMPLPAQGV